MKSLKKQVEQSNIWFKSRRCSCSTVHITYSNTDYIKFKTGT